MESITWTNVYTWISSNSDVAVGLGLIAALALISCPFVYRTDDWEWLTFAPKRRGKMLRKARRAFVEADAADGFTSYVEDRVYHGDYTREEAKEIYRKLKRSFPIRNLFPKPELLKEAIRRRLANNIHEPVNLPDKKSAVKPKHMFDKVVL